MEELRLEQTSGQWRLFIDLSKVSFKAVLLHNVNTFLSISLVHAVHMKEMYEYLQVLLQKIRNEEHRWNICAALQVITMLNVLQGGYTKFCCF
jgi:hypothetical protein